MRKNLTLSAATLLIGIGTQSAAHAVGNVLLPDDNTPSVTSSPQTKPNDTSTPTTKTDAQLPVMSDPVTVTPTQTPTPAYTPIPQPSVQPSDFGNYQIPQPIIHKTANGTNITIPTTIFNIPETPTIPETNTTYARMIQIGLATKGFTANDMTAITKKLGFTADRISSLCSPSMNGIVSTSKAPRMFDSKNQPFVSVGYNGNLSSILVTMQALCTAVPLGPELGFIKQIGNKYAVDLGFASCKTPVVAENTAPPATVTIVRDGPTPIAKCTFQ